MYEHTRNGIIKAGFNAKLVELLAASMAFAKDLTEANDIYLKFEIEAEKLPWPQDCDFGALALQVNHTKASNTEVAKYMLSKALIRARWCATCSTSGGEGLARMVHVNELEKELLKYN